MGHNRLNFCRIICLGLALLLPVVQPGIAPLAKAKDTQAIIAFGQVAGYSGEEVSVPVTITNNPGLATFRFQVEYDANALTPVAVQRGPLLADGALYSNEEGNDTGLLSFLWYHTQDVRGDGELAVIRFRVASTADDANYPLKVHHSPEDISNAALETIPHTVQDGSVHVEQRPTYITIKPPDKLRYQEGETLDLTGMTVTAHYADGTAKETSDYKVLGFDSSPGEKEIVVTVQGVSATFTVTVLEHIHNMVKTEFKPATHEQDGNIEYYTCTKCGKKYNDALGTKELTDAEIMIKATGHIYGDTYQFDESRHWKECSCGYRTDIEPHAFGEWVVTLPPTNDTEGIQEHICTVCVKTEQQAIPVVYLPGDADGSGEVTSSDALLALQAATGKIDLTGAALDAADVDGDGTIESADALLILQFATRKISSLTPVE